MSTSDRATPDDLAHRILSEFLERHERGGADPETLFAAHPEHAERLRRWWRRLAELGEVSAAGASGERFGPYRLLGELGRGAQGTVHLAEDTRLGRRVALKLLPAHRGLSVAAQRRFRREAELVARLDHPGVCTIYEAGEEQGTAFIAMRLVEGETLAARLARTAAEGRPLPVPDSVLLCAEVARILQAAHDRQLVHRDIKPGNLMVDRAGRPVILDFGLALHSEDGASLTLTGDLLGTPAYMSPEQLVANRIPIDGRTDVYSLGVVLFECLTLRRPFHAPTHAALYEQILNAPLPDPRRLERGIGRDLAVVLETALARDRRLRYQTAADLAEDLQRVARGEPILARPPGPWQRLSSWTRRHPTLAASLALSAVLLLGGTAAAVALDRAQAALGRLADMETLRAAVHEEATDLFPAVPARRVRFERWLDSKAEPLARRLPEYRAQLATLRAGAAPAATRPASQPAQVERVAILRAQIEAVRGNADKAGSRLRRDALLYSVKGLEQELARLVQEPEGSEPTFDTPARLVEFRTLSTLVRELDWFLAPGGPVARVRERLEFARTVQQRSIDDHRDRWAAAQAFTRASERYGHRELPVQVGLVPLGPDPDSGLLEFVHLRSGAVPARDARGRLVLEPDTGIVLVLLPGGRMVLGASLEPGHPQHDPEGSADEGPPGEVELDWFLLGKHELAHGQWRRLGGTTFDPSEPGAAADLDPVVHVTWYHAEQLLRWEGLDLPSEAQWEVGLRAGSTTQYFVGGGPRGLEPYVHGRLAPGGELPEHAARIDSLRPNALGLHHMAGNVLEWCRDSYIGSGPSGFAHAPGTGERMLADTGRRVVRGGSFRSESVRSFRNAWRGIRAPAEHRHDHGLRVARRVDP